MQRFFRHARRRKISGVFRWAFSATQPEPCLRYPCKCFDGSPTQIATWIWKGSDAVLSKSPLCWSPCATHDLHLGGLCLKFYEEWNNDGGGLFCDKKYQTDSFVLSCYEEIFCMKSRKISTMTEWVQVLSASCTSEWQGYLINWSNKIWFISYSRSPIASMLHFTSGFTLVLFFLPKSIHIKLKTFILCVYAFLARNVWLRSEFQLDHLGSKYLVGAAVCWFIMTNTLWSVPPLPPPQGSRIAVLFYHSQKLLCLHLIFNFDDRSHFEEILEYHWFFTLNRIFQLVLFISLFHWALIVEKGKLIKSMAMTSFRAENMWIGTSRFGYQLDVFSLCVCVSTTANTRRAEVRPFSGAVSLMRPHALISLSIASLSLHRHPRPILKELELLLRGNWRLSLFPKSKVEQGKGGIPFPSTCVMDPPLVPVMV